jgi:hypothetical protein
LSPDPVERAMAFEVSEVDNITVIAGGTVAAKRPQDFKKLRRSSSLFLNTEVSLSICRHPIFEVFFLDSHAPDNLVSDIRKNQPISMIMLVSRLRHSIKAGN